MALVQDVPADRIIMEGTLPLCVDGIWSYCHLQVSSGFAVGSRKAREVFKGGWGCKTEFVLSGCHVWTSVPEHRALVCDMSQHITGKSEDRLARWDYRVSCLQHPYSNPACLSDYQLL